MRAAAGFTLAISLAVVAVGAAFGQDDPVPEVDDLPPPPPKDSPEPPSVPPLPDVRAGESTPTPAELGALPDQGRGTGEDAGTVEENQPSGSRRGPWWRQPVIAERLGITREQANRLDRALETFVSARASASGEMTEARRSLLAILGGGEQGDAAQALDAWTSAHHAMIDARTAFLRSVIDTLDDTQLETLARQAPRALIPGGRDAGREQFPASR